jgi:hypothetical protein
VSRSFDVHFKPVPPSGVTAAKPEGTSEVTVTWKPNPEPDMVGYFVYRSYNGGSAKPLSGDLIPASASPSIKDNLAGAPSGQYRYGVVAVRHARTCKSPTNDSACDSGIQSLMSPYSGSVTVQGQGAQSTTTTTRPPTKGGGGSTGGSGGSGSTGGSTGGSGGTSSGGSTGSGSKSGSGGVKLGNGGGIASGGGDVDLRQFAGLLNGSNKPGSGSGGRNADGTYDPTLPYGSDGKPESSSGDNSLVTIGGTSIPKPNEDWVRFIGAGSLATALLVHVLWFKQQVDQIPLESLAD